MSDLTTLIFLSVCGFGAVLFYLGWFRKVKGEGLFCAQCGYRVDQSAGVQCSECGSNTDNKGAVPWQRVKNKYLIASSIVTLLIGCLLMSSWFLVTIQNVSMIPYFPTWYLLKTDVTTNNDFGAGEIKELRIRTAAGKLSDSQLATFTSLLCDRSVNVHTDNKRFGTPVRFTGMTLDLVRKYPPGDKQLQTMLETLIDKNAIEADVYSTESLDVVVVTPLLAYKPETFSFDRSANYPILVGIIDVVTATEAEQACTIVPVRITQGKFNDVIIYAAQISPVSSRQIDLNICVTWFLVYQHVDGPMEVFSQTPSR